MMISQFSALVGNESAKSLLLGDFREGTVKNGYVIEGARGSGKRTIARLFCMMLDCENPTEKGPCGTCRACDRHMRALAPDVITVSRGERATIGVDAVRAIRESLYVAPSEAERKVYIIEEAHRMTTEAQNALLLSLEEPPPFVVFLLLAEDASLLLETVRSRAPTVRTELLKTEKLEAHLRKDARFAALAARDEGRFRALLMASGGAVGRAEELLDAAELDAQITLRETALSLVRAALSSSGGKYDIVPTLPQKGEPLTEVLKNVLAVLRDGLAAKKLPQAETMFFYSADEARAFARRYPASSLLSLFDRTAKAIEQLAGNASPALTVFTLLSGK